MRNQLKSIFVNARKDSDSKILNILDDKLNMNLQELDDEIAFDYIDYFDNMVIEEAFNAANLLIQTRIENQDPAITEWNHRQVIINLLENKVGPNNFIPLPEAIYKALADLTARWSVHNGSSSVSTNNGKITYKTPGRGITEDDNSVTNAYLLLREEIVDFAEMAYEICDETTLHSLGIIHRYLNSNLNPDECNQVQAQKFAEFLEKRFSTSSNTKSAPTKNELINVMLDNNHSEDDPITNVVINDALNAEDEDYDHRDDDETINDVLDEQERLGDIGEPSIVIIEILSTTENNNSITIPVTSEEERSDEDSLAAEIQVTIAETPNNIGLEGVIQNDAIISTGDSVGI